MSHKIHIAVPASILPDTNTKTSKVATLYTNDIKGSSSDWKKSVVVSTDSDVQLFDFQEINGIQLVKDDRVLVKNQINKIENGIYTVDVEWVRSIDFPRGYNASGSVVYDNSKKKIFTCVWMTVL